MHTSLPKVTQTPSLPYSNYQSSEAYFGDTSITEIAIFKNRCQGPIARSTPCTHISPSLPLRIHNENGLNLFMRTGFNCHLPWQSIPKTNVTFSRQDTTMWESFVAHACAIPKSSSMHPWPICEFENFPKLGQHLK